MTLSQDSPRSTTDNLTASTDHNQGNGQLTADRNYIICENEDDTVTAPLAIVGKELVVYNEGPFALLIFPSPSEVQSRGMPVDSPFQLSPLKTATFIANAGGEWRLKSSTDTKFGSMGYRRNTSAYTITAADEFHAFHVAAMIAGELQGFDFDAGGAGTGHTITAIADAGGGDITVTTLAAHGLSVDDIISQTGLTDAAYVGIFQVLSVPTTTAYTVTAVFIATDAGSMDQAATLTAQVGSSGQYDVKWSASAMSLAVNQEFDFVMVQNAQDIIKTENRRKFAIQNDFGHVGGFDTVDVEDGDKFVIVTSNVGNTAAIVIRNLSIMIERLP